MMFQLNSTRLIVLMEVEPQSNRYAQFMFDREQFKKVSNAVGDCYEMKSKEGDIEEYDIELTDQTVVLPDLPESYEK